MTARIPSVRLTAEINSYKQIAGQAIFEIGRRLKHVKENDLVHGEFGKWLESVDIEWRTANRMMQAYDQFGNSSTSTNLPFSKIVEMLSLPNEVDREQFINEKHEIPSKGVSKTVDEMTVKELREVKKALTKNRPIKSGHYYLANLLNPFSKRVKYSSLIF